MAKGLRLRTDASGQASLLQLSEVAPKAASLALPGFGLTLAADAKGDLKLASVSPTGAASRQGLAEFVGQPAQLLSSPGPLATLELQFSPSDPFTGQTHTQQFRLQAEPASQRCLI